MKNNGFWKRIIYRPGPVLDPISRLSEVIFGLIMVLTFTGSISAASSGRSEIGVILRAALGCNIAWGIVDAFMYIMSLMMERGDAANSLRNAQNSGNEEAYEQLKEFLPPAIAEVMTKEQLESIRVGLRNLPEPPKRIPLFWRDIRAAILIFFLVALSTLPCSIPFLLIKDPVTAMRVSNAVAILLLFIAGFRLAKYTGYNKLLFGVIVAVVGFVLVGMTMALGG